MSSKVIQKPKSTDANTQPKPMTKVEMLQKMLADQKLIREALEKGISLKELEQKHGFRFARL